MQRTIVDRFGWPKVLGVALAVGCLAGFISNELGHSDGPPACAMAYRDVQGAGAQERNEMVECDDAIDKWCAENHPEDPEGCTNAVLIDGDARNVGKE
jgi:hypothetical protein